MDTDVLRNTTCVLNRATEQLETKKVSHGPIFMNDGERTPQSCVSTSLPPIPGQTPEQAMKPVVWEHLEKKTGGPEQGGAPEESPVCSASVLLRFLIGTISGTAWL